MKVLVRKEEGDCSRFWGLKGVILPKGGSPPSPNLKLSEFHAIIKHSILIRGGPPRLTLHSSVFSDGLIVLWSAGM